MRLFSYLEFINESEKRSGKPKWETWAKWRTLINMSASEIERFLNSSEGKDAGLSRSEAKKEGGINTGRDSARALLRMIPNGGSWKKALDNWSPLDWYWAGRQNSFNSRMRGMKPTTRDPYVEKDGGLTDWYKSMLIWGHDPKKPLSEMPKKPDNL